MKPLFFGLIITLCTLSASAQTFKITDFVSDNSKFDEAEARLMGKQLVLVIYDNSVSVKVGDEKPELLHKVSSDEYNLILTTPNSKETQTLNLKLERLFAFITTVKFTFSVNENAGLYRHGSCTVTAKRF